MEYALLSYLRSIPEFDKAYYKAKDFVREHINPYCDSLELDIDSKCDICFPLTEDNLFVIGLDIKHLTIWVFHDTFLEDCIDNL